MSLLTVSELAKSFGAQDIFENVSLAVPHQARTALLGPNGVGKTTLLRILVGLETSDRGRIQRARNVRIGYLPQEADLPRSGQSARYQTLRDHCLKAFADLKDMEAELADLERAMAEPSQVEKAMSRYGSLQEAFERAGGYSYAWQIDRVLAGLGFKPSDHRRPLTELSGGERTRALLAGLLLEDPDLLVLDEPTNHLDLEAIEWLEGWFRDWPGAAIFVSHDRYFLDRTAEMVWELSPQGVETYRGNYTAFIRQRKERGSLQARRYRAQQEHIQSEAEYIRSNIAGQQARQAKGRRKRLERLLKEEALEAAGREHSVRIGFESARRSGDRVLQTEGLLVGYPEMPEPLYRVPDLVLQRGECAALLGPNGAGKTALLKTLVGQVSPLGGVVRLGASLKVGYFAQAHEGLDTRRTVIQEFMNVDEGISRSQARELLARYLFTGDEIEKPVEVLSGGERGRLALAKLALEGANFLLLDEPTNHLDVMSQQVLQDALAAFRGTILLASHDRYLIQALATQIWSISPTSQEMEVFRAGYSDYLASKRQAETVASEQRRRSTPRPDTQRGARPGASKAELKSVEERIESIENALEAIASQIADVGGDIGEVQQLGTKYAQLQAELEAQMELWERLSSDQTPA